MTYSGSSLEGRKRNRDGSQNVYCVTCGKFICTSAEELSRIECELCRRVLQDEALTTEAIQMYQMSKEPQTDVPMAVLPEHDVTTSAQKFSLKVLAGRLVQAVGFPKTKDTLAKESKKVSQARQRGRLFENVTLGDMKEIDERLKK